MAGAGVGDGFIAPAAALAYATLEQSAFAWTPQGSPRPDFKLSAAAVMEGQDLLLTRLAARPGDPPH